MFCLLISDCRPVLVWWTDGYWTIRNVNIPRKELNQIKFLSFLTYCRTPSETVMPKASIIIILWQWKKTKAHNLKLNWWSYGKLYYSSSHQQKSEIKILKKIKASKIFSFPQFSKHWTFELAVATWLAIIGQSKNSTYHSYFPSNAVLHPSIRPVQWASQSPLHQP